MLGSVRQIIWLFFVSIIAHFKAYSQLIPANNAHLNYSSICFEFPWVEHAASYELTLTEMDSGEQTTYTSTANKCIVNALTFGESYQWFVTSKNQQNKGISVTEKQTFTIDEHFKTGRHYLRFKEITNNPLTHSNELLILDYAGVVINRNEEIVWYLPSLPFLSPTSALRDLKLTDEGTFLAIVDSNAYEFDRNGSILWKAPNNGVVSHQRTEDYHHDFQKLPTGNYMVLGNEKQRRVLSGRTDTSRYEIGTIIEYDPSGKVVWEWHASQFFTDELLQLRKKEEGGPNLATHLNAFHVVGNTVYAGFRDASWILKIDKLTKQVVEIYGGNESGLPNHYGKNLFHFQHDATVLRNGSMAVVNNDSIKNATTFSSMVVFSLGENDEPKGKELFRFGFNFDSLCSGKSLKLGNVEELQNGNFLVNMGAIHRIFEVTPAGEITWDIFVEKLDTVKRVWRFYPQYRVAPVSSLYPNEFSVKWTPKKVKNESIEGILTLYNIGTEKNPYIVYAEQKDGNLIRLSDISFVEPNQSTTVNIRIPKKLFEESSNLVLRVQAKGKTIFEQLTIFSQ